MRYTLSPSARTARLSSDGLKVADQVLGADLLEVLCAFEAPQTVQEAFEALALDSSLEQFGEVVRTLASRGYLEEVTRPDVGLEALLNPDVLEARGDLREYLRRGRAVTIPNALKPEFAEEVYRALQASTAWTLYQGTFPFFQFSQHNLLADAVQTGLIGSVYRTFAAASTRALLTDLSGSNCSGEIEFGASWYQPGDYALPHVDVRWPRTVAFVWHLTKGWSPRWGGDFFWAPTGRMVSPQFNALTVFNVSARSLHSVCPVSSQALQQRFAVTGWWTTAEPRGAIDEARRSPPLDKAPLTPPTEGYSADVMPIDHPRLWVL